MLIFYDPSFFNDFLVNACNFFPFQMQEGIPPRMFKAVIAASHPEFSTMRQQVVSEVIANILNK